MPYMSLESITGGRTRQNFWSGSVRNFRGGGAAALLFFVGFLIPAGCSSDPKPADELAAKPEDLAPWNSGRRPKRSPPPRNRVATTDNSPVVLGDVDPSMLRVDRGRTGEEGLWSVLLGAYRGPEAEVQAQQTLARVQLAGIPGAYAEKREETWVVAFGGYKDPGSAEAQQELNAIRELKVGDEQPFAGATLTPPVTTRIGTMPEFDLGLVRKRPGGQRAKYTLQVAQYCRPDNGQPTQEEMAEFRKAAEEACVRLRREGEDAYFHHGPRMSSVTVGLFTEDDFQTTSSRSREPGAIIISRKPIESAALKEARERYPYNLINGQAARVKMRGSEGKMVPSTVVAIPE